MSATSTVRVSTEAFVMPKAPVCVDLDGTLLRTDSLYEMLVALIRQRPALLLCLPMWLVRGKAYFKCAVASHVSLDVARLPYNEEVLRYLRQEHRAGRRILLATGAGLPVARRVADHFELFSGVIATSETVNMTGGTKLEKLREEIGSTEFVYLGNSKVDIAIWRESKYAIPVNAPNRVVRGAKRVATVLHRIEDRKPTLKTLLRSMRVHQWVKNLLVFVPLVAGHHFTELARISEATLAFLAFSLCASGVYLVNDLCDLDSDRQHPDKKRRPLSAGDMQVRNAIIAIPLLWVGALTLALMVNTSFLLVLGAYLTATLLYSFWLKRIVLVDVFLLAVLYTVRMIGGSVATGITLSNWLMLFSLFMFLNLAFLKRFAEIRKIGKDIGQSRGYRLADVEQLTVMGAASGYITALVLALYINSEEVTVLYRRPEFLWAMCPLILYWVSRNWILAARGEVEDDPVVFAIRDRVTLSIGLVAAVVFALAT